MSNNPTATLARPRINFCLAMRMIEGEWATCTRITTHDGHCCDEIRRVAWVGSAGTVFDCKARGYDHSVEKGLGA